MKHHLSLLLLTITGEVIQLENKKSRAYPAFFEKLSIPLLHSIFQLLTRSELGHSGSCNSDGFPGLRIASHTGFPLAYSKSAKTYEANLSPFFQGTGDPIQSGSESLIRLGFV